MKMQTLLNDTIYRKLATDLTANIERQAVALIKKSAITQEWLDKILPHASVPPRLYGLPKIHKDDVALIPIVNYIGSPTYGLAKYLAGLLRPFIGQSIHHITNSKSFVNKLCSIKLQDTDMLVSIDVMSLFTRVPLEDTLHMLSQHFDNLSH
jgi:hypothetical protein